MQRTSLGRGQTLKLDRFISSSHFPTHNIFPQHSGKLLPSGDQLTFSPLLSCGGSQHACVVRLKGYSNKYLFDEVGVHLEKLCPYNLTELNLIRIFLGSSQNYGETIAAAMFSVHNIFK